MHFQLFELYKDKFPILVFWDEAEVQAGFRSSKTIPPNNTASEGWPSKNHHSFF